MITGAIKRNLPLVSEGREQTDFGPIFCLHAVLQRIGLFQHRYMGKPQYAIEVFTSRLQHAGLIEKLPGKKVLELDTGGSTTTASIAHATVLRLCWLIRTTMPNWSFCLSPTRGCTARKGSVANTIEHVTA